MATVVKNLKKTDRKWLNIACNLVQTHLIYAKIEVSHLYVCLLTIVLKMFPMTFKYLQLQGIPIRRA